jgi:tetratricopeptide (TPR) repeat protein
MHCHDVNRVDALGLDMYSAAPMTSNRIFAIGSVLLIVVGALSSAGCESLDGRSRNRKANRLFRETQFVDAAAEYEQAIKKVDDPTIHYNLGLAYSKIFRPGLEGKIMLDVAGSPGCTAIPGVVPVSKQVCVKPDDKHFAECDEKNVCPSSFKCAKTDLCALDDAALADLAAQHFLVWVKSHPDDAETRGIMTQVWMDSSQFPKAIEYWQSLLAAKPNDPEIMGALAGINLKGGDWRKSIEWYNKVAEISTDTSAKVAAYQFIGNVAWSKLNSKTLGGLQAVELADRGIGALQKAAELQPDNPKPVGLQASISNFRGQAMGASWAGAIDRTSAQDLQHSSRVLRDKAKAAVPGVPGVPSAPAAPGSGAPAATNNSPARTGG